MTTKQLFKLAYQDSRRNRGRLFMFISSIILGITALVAINSFNYNLVKDIDNQAKTISGADVTINSKKAFSSNVTSQLEGIPGDKATEQELFSMAYLPKSDASQFVRIKALEGAFPFYGKLKTEPQDAWQQYQSKGTVLVDHNLMEENGLLIGDSIKLGDYTFMIEGRLLSSFGNSGMGSTFAPSIYIPLEKLAVTNLVQPGSLIEYAYYLKVPDAFDMEEWKAEHKKEFETENVRIETLKDQKRNLKEAFNFLNNFLNLVALVSLILGCLGVASSVLIYIRSKKQSIAVLRCLGMRGNQAFLVFFIQIAMLGLVGVLIGALLGSLIQIALPALLKDVLPYEVNLAVSYRAILEGVTIGLFMTMLFALIPLLSTRLVSPLSALRAQAGPAPKDPLRNWVLVGSIVFLFMALWLLTRDLRLSIYFLLGLAITFGCLYLMASLLMKVVRDYMPTQWSYELRQGISNLYRPNNQTKTLVISIGLGTTILTMLIIVQSLLLNNVKLMDAGNQPNMIVFGIENHQRDSIKDITKSLDMPVLQDVPIVTMRLEAWKGRSKNEWLADTTSNLEKWAVNREARVTYRDSLDTDETLIAGTFHPTVVNDSIYVTLYEDYAAGLGVDIGDELIWNVQGAKIKTYVSGFRNIKFNSMNTRFFIVFPTGVLEKAPQFNVLVTKTPNNEAMRSYRTTLVKRFPNVSVVDLSSILVTLNDILTKISYIIKFMAGFSVLTGVVVLLSSLLLSKYQRIRESVLLRTLGASKRQLFSINAVEYLMLGTIAAVTGVILAIGAGYLLSVFVFELPNFYVEWGSVMLTCFVIIALATAIGLWNTRSIVRESPLQVLRAEMG